MAETFKGKVEEAGHKLAEAATKVGHKVTEKVEEAADWAKEKSHQVGHKLEETAQKTEHRAKETLGFGATTQSAESKIREHMNVFGSCGNKVGRVDRVEGSTIKLTKNDSPDGQHHLIPIGWVDHVDDSVHLNMTCDEAEQEWNGV